MTFFLSDIYSELTTSQSVVKFLIPITLRTTQCFGNHYLPHFTDEETGTKES